MTTNMSAEPALYHENPPSHRANQADVPDARRVAGRQARAPLQNGKPSLTEPQAQWQQFRRDNSSTSSDWSRRGAADAALEFGRFRVLLRQRQLVADGVPIELGTRALDLLLALLEADGSLVAKDELRSRVWPGIVVAEENLKVQICALRKALGEDCDFIRTEFGRGYRFTAAVRSTVVRSACQRPPRAGHSSSQRSVPRRISRRPPHGRGVPRSHRQTL
jgi:DNA-binding winged helix-turn-helix (wHTH) protein